MSILDPTQITLMRAISGATLRNTVLANNIANADTPGLAERGGDLDRLRRGREAARSYAATADARARA